MTLQLYLYSHEQAHVIQQIHARERGEMPSGEPPRVVLINRQNPNNCTEEIFHYEEWN